MDLPLFRESIERSHKILESKGLDLIKIVTDDDPNVFDNILNSFVGIAAVQVTLTSIICSFFQFSNSNNFSSVHFRSLSLTFSTP